MIKLKKLGSLALSFSLILTVGVTFSLTDQSSQVYAASKMTKPAVKVTQKAGSGALKLSWTGKGATEYRVYRTYKYKNSKGTWTTAKYKRIYTAKGKTYTNSGLKAGYVYYYKVRGVKTAKGQKNKYSSYSKYVKSMLTPGQVSPSVKQTGRYTMKVSWSSVKGASAYEVYKSTGGSYSLVKTTTSKSYTDSSATTSKVYYKVKGINKGAFTSESKVGKISTYKKLIRNTNFNDGIYPMQTKLTNAEAVKVGSTLTGVKITYDASAQATSYDIYRSRNETTGYVKIGSSTTTSFVDTYTGIDLTKEKGFNNYYYRVVAVNSKGESDYSSNNFYIYFNNNGIYKIFIKQTSK